VAGEEFLVAADVVLSLDRLAWFACVDGVDEAKRRTVWQQRYELVGFGSHALRAY
jgi:hypothetical protein